jgi:ribosome-binding ATPase YchF (GTP1/OBG family)
MNLRIAQHPKAKPMKMSQNCGSFAMEEGTEVIVICAKLEAELSGLMMK